MRKFSMALAAGLLSSFLSVLPASAAACATTDSTVTISGESYELVQISATGTCSWTVPTGVEQVDLLVVAGGGGGGGGAGWDTGTKNGGGGGGGAGGFGIQDGISLTPGETIEVTVGAGGSRGTSGGATSNGGDGADGGLSSVVVSGTTYSENGGEGGQGGRETGGTGGDSGDSLSGGTPSGKQAGSGGSSEGAGSATISLNGGTSSDFSGAAATYSSGGGGGNATQYGVNPTGTPGSGGNGGRGSQQHPIYNYGYLGNAGANGIVMLRYKTLTTPQPPSNVNAEGRYLSALVSWAAPTNTGNTSISGYKVEMLGGSGWQTVRENTGGTGTSLTVQNLKVGKTYRFRVTAINSVGNSSVSESSAEMTLTYHSPPYHPIPSVAPGGLTVSLDKVNSRWLVEMTGRRLNSILTGSVAGIALEFIGQTDRFLSFGLPLSLDSGTYELTFDTTLGLLSIQNLLTITQANLDAATEPLQPKESADPEKSQRVSIGSFKGFVAVYTLGYEGSRLSAKIGNDWLIVESIVGKFARHLERVGSGVSILVRVYIDRELVETKELVTQ